MLETLKISFDKWTRITPKNALYDRALIWLYLLMLSVGFIMVASASIPSATKLYNDPFFFIKRDAFYLVLSCLVCYFFVAIRMDSWKKWSLALLIVAILLLIAVLIPGVGKMVNGSRRWISFIVFNFQPAEFAKLATIAYFADYLSRQLDIVRQKGLIIVRLAVFLALVGGLLILQPDLGSAFVIGVITFAMLFIAGARLFQFLLAGGSAIGLVFLAIFTSAYRLRRITAYQDPFADPYGAGFQLSNSLMAFGRGDIWGSGLGNSIQKFYLPEAHTDFVMAILGEEFGFIGIMMIILLLSLLVFRALKISKESLQLEKNYRGFFAFGIAVWMSIQGFVNLAMTMGAIPTKGLTFPLISYGDQA